MIEFLKMWAGFTLIELAFVINLYLIKTIFSKEK